ncbi:addiction module protein [Candidatus Peregrinibacteria bacterium RIFOXYB2_FULL_32_7]|nr:MAG: addiction module protein [Candidatus Peregrinibacteria bacterium RIFOXYB2_FULL_32_7]
MSYIIPQLPYKNIIETPRILKKAIVANKVIAELKGLAQTIPNQTILINTIALQESKDSSEVENIVTTHDELFKYDKQSQLFSLATKEVYRYNEALFYGVKMLKTKPITNNLLIKIMQIITQRQSEFRNLPGTVLKNGQGEIVYMPPQNLMDILKYMENLERFINDRTISDFDPLVKMAIIHHQFESIHPFFDGNGRTGRILNILYLISEEILELPILYLSKYIIKNKLIYYNLLQKVRDKQAWEEWIIFMLEALENTAKQTIVTIEAIKLLMAEYKRIIKEKEPKLYSHELINTIFSHPYTKIEFITINTKVSRLTASKHLQKLVNLGLLQLKKHKNTNYYINTKLLSIFTAL